MTMFNNKNIVVTGGAGFIGSHLVEKLLCLGANVKVIDNFLNGNKIEHLLNNENLIIYKDDVRDSAIVDFILKDSDIVFHLAAVVGVEEACALPLDVLDTEIIGTVNILRASVKYNVKKIIFASSSEVYGDRIALMTEDMPLFPKSTYAIAKVIGELYCDAFNRKHGLQYTILRYFNVYGNRQDKRFVIPRFIDNILKKDDIVIYGNGEQIRDFTHIDDVINMTLLAATRNEASNQILNIGTGIPTDINYLIDTILNVYNCENKVKLIYKEYDSIRPRNIEVFCRIANTDKAKLILQYMPTLDLKQGIIKLKNESFGMNCRSKI